MRLNSELNHIHNIYFDELYRQLESAKKYYPDFRSWYYKKVIPDILNNQRDFILEYRQDKIVGLSLVKYEERKLCTLKVFDEYQNKGYGLKLFEKSFEALDTDKPFLTVSEEKYVEFEKIFKYFNFELTSVKNGLYRNDKIEYFFNER